jgi:hypothetical protein
VVRNAKGKLLPLLKLIWLTKVWGEPWSDLRAMTETPSDVDDLLNGPAILIKSCDTDKLPTQAVPGEKSKCTTVPDIDGNSGSAV